MFLRPSSTLRAVEASTGSVNRFCCTDDSTTGCWDGLSDKGLAKIWELSNKLWVALLYMRPGDKDGLMASIMLLSKKCWEVTEKLLNLNSSERRLGGPIVSVIFELS